MSSPRKSRVRLRSQTDSNSVPKSPSPSARRQRAAAAQPLSNPGNVSPISRRRAIQILGFGGAGMGAILLGCTSSPLSPDNSPSSAATSSTVDAPSPSGSSAAPPNTENLIAFDFETVTVTDTGEIATRETKQANGFRQTIGNSFMEMVDIPNGTFMMGQSETEKEELIRHVGEENYQDWYTNELPRREVAVFRFFMGKYQVTQAQWRAVAALPRVERDLEADPARFKGDNRPVERVSWDDAVEFCQRLSQQTGQEYRLPSEAEWEYACRAGTTTPFHFGETITTDLANYAGIDNEFGGITLPGNYGQGPRGGEYRERTTDVGSFPANGFGLYDMHGNVGEWCADHRHDSYEGAPTDGSAWVSSDENNLRLMRGGSWSSGPWSCRSAFRSWNSRDVRYDYLGFRVVCASL